MHDIFKSLWKAFLAKIHSVNYVQMISALTIYYQLRQKLLSDKIISRNNSYVANFCFTSW